MPRTIDTHYRDPVDQIWIRTARRLGMEVVRSEEVYASWDGDRRLTLSTPAHFDPDDSLAQMIFHEICHALVEGGEGQRKRDWGLDNVDDRHLIREQACHRLQAALSDAHGLRTVLAVTTDFRPHYDALPADPLGPAETHPSADLARDAWLPATKGPWADAIQQALVATATIAEATRPFADEDSLWAHSRPRHPLGPPLHPDEVTCGNCAWAHMAGPGPRVPRCRRLREGQSPAPRISEQMHGCDFWEPRLEASSCTSCGACCHRGFHMVPVKKGEPLTHSHPHWLVSDAHGRHLPRPDGFCVALEEPHAPWRCGVYASRPTACKDFEVGGDACLEARRRVGLSR